MVVIGPSKRLLQRAANAVLSQAKHDRVGGLAAFNGCRHEARKTKDVGKRSLQESLMSVYFLGPNSDVKRGWSVDQVPEQSDKSRRNGVEVATQARER
jgi:hypothetical protein